MTELLYKAFKAVQKTSPEMQDAVARLMLDMMDDGMPEAVPAEHLAAVLEGEGQADRGEFATDAQLAAALRRFEQ